MKANFLQCHYDLLKKLHKLGLHDISISIPTIYVLIARDINNGNHVVWYWGILPIKLKGCGGFLVNVPSNAVWEMRCQHLKQAYLYLNLDMHCMNRNINF